MATTSDREHSTSPRDYRRDGDHPEMLTVREAARLLRIGRNTCYDLVREGRIPSVRLGRIIRIPHHALLSWLEQRTTLDPNDGVVSFPPMQDPVPPARRHSAP